MISPNSIFPTEGYNYERIEYEGTIFGIWDISGDKKFRSLIKTFYENIEINLILFFVRIFVDLLEFDENQTNIIKKDDENPLKRQIESLIESRKLLHFLVNEQELKKTPILLICNNEVNLLGKSYTEEDWIGEIKSFLRWNEIENPKNILCLKLGKYSAEYETVWRNVTELLSKK